MQCKERGDGYGSQTHAWNLDVPITKSWILLVTSASSAKCNQ